MSRCFAYIRVSTVKQGQQGVSLEAQREAIERYAQRSGLVIVEWFEESRTAAKQGRPAFARMLSLLRRRRAEGVVVHKIDRSARNLRDWADFSALGEQGITIHIAAEALDLSSRGGRLSADIQAVVAADYVRNLRDEARKGFYGRLKQGLLPVRAPIGYVDNGGGKAKTIDPEKGPLVRELFERYATGTYSLGRLACAMSARGLRNHAGKALDVNGLSRVLNNPFYAGLIEVKTTGETFEGAHARLISRALFEKAQDVLHGRVRLKRHREPFVHRRLFTCGLCGTALIGERQKGNVYYRCHTRGCPTRCTREELLDAAIEAQLSRIMISAEEERSCEAAFSALGARHLKANAEAAEGLRLELSVVAGRIERLTDLLVDGVLSREAYEQKHGRLLAEKLRLEERAREIEASESWLLERTKRYLELAKTAPLTYKTASPVKKRQIVELMTSNRSVSGREVFVELRNPFGLLADREFIPQGGGSRVVPRTLPSEGTPKTPREETGAVSPHEALILTLMDYCKSTVVNPDNMDLIQEKRGLP